HPEHLVRLEQGEPLDQDRERAQAEERQEQPGSARQHPMSQHAHEPTRRQPQEHRKPSTTEKARRPDAEERAQADEVPRTEKRMQPAVAEWFAVKHGVARSLRPEALVGMD